MKPINDDNPGCTPISSDCVIWQGPDIACINLCKGDSVSGVVYKLAEKLCEVLETLNIETYDISCLEIGNCGPEDFQALIQLLITKICELEGVTPTPAPNGTVGCPDCTVNIASCFYYDNPQGDQETTMQLTDYVTAIGNYICSIAGQIGTINGTLNSQNQRITALENAPAPTLNLPNMAPVCVLPPSPLVPIDQVLIALEQQFCALRTATGEPNDIYAALLFQCAGLNQSPSLQGSGNMSDIAGWNSTVTNLAQGVENMWLTLCDIRAAVKSIQDVCCTGTNCDDLDIEVQGVLTSPTTLQLYFTGTFPSGFGECNQQGALVTITDSSNNSMNVYVQIPPNLNDPGGFQVNLSGSPLNTAENLVISVPLCFTDGESQCAKTITDFVLNTTVCPPLGLTPTETTIDYNATYAGGAASIAVKLFDATGTVEISSQVTVVTGPTGISGTFSGLSAGIQYKVRMEITPTGSAAATICPFASVTTVPPACLPPVNVVAAPIIIT